MKFAHAAMAIFAIAVISITVGFFAGKKWAGATAATVAIAAAGAAHQVKKTREQAEKFSEKIAGAISESESQQDVLKSDTVKSHESDKSKVRHNIDTGESGWERRRIFPDS